MNRFLGFAVVALIATSASAQTLPNGRVSTRPLNDNSAFQASTAYVDRMGASKAPLANPVFTGVPIAPAIAIANGTAPSVPYTFAGFSNLKTSALISATGQSENGPETALSVQLVSNGGSSNHYGNFKPALTVVYQALKGAADGWGANIVASSASDVEQNTGLIALELNLNNNHYQATGAFATPYTSGLYITGAGSKTSMSAIGIGGDRPLYRDALHFEDKSPAMQSTITNATINDESKSPNILVSNTSHINGVDFINANFTGFPFRAKGFSVDGTGNITAPTANLSTISISGNAGSVLSVAGTHTLGIDLINATIGAFAFRSAGYTVDGVGAVTASKLTSTGTLDVTGGISAAGAQIGTVNAVDFLIAPRGTPGSGTASCTAGQMQSDPNFIYVCVSTNTWKRTALSTF